LSREENLNLLGEAIQAELTLESVERAVGPFRADLLCKDASDGRWVLIENQIERTDHIHLGQLITYAAGLSAVTVVWIAKTFTEEHRAALDWLNEVTGPDIAFYGLEIELWRIGDSPAAPKFNVVSSPNVFVKARVAERSAAEASPRAAQNNAYWDAFGAYLQEKGSWFKPMKCSGGDFITWGGGTSGVAYAAKMYRPQGKLVARVYTGGHDSKALYHRLLAKRESIDAYLPGLEWEEHPGRVESYINFNLMGQDFENEAQWPAQFEWMQGRLEALRDAFAPIIAGLRS